MTTIAIIALAAAATLTVALPFIAFKAMFKAVQAAHSNRVVELTPAANLRLAA
jgi:hypothetical protein